MTVATLLFLPPDDSQPWHWWRVDGDAVVAEGDGLPDVGAEGHASAGEVIAIAPADAVTLHWADLPARSAAQAAAAARVVVSDATAEPARDMHVAVGAEREGERAIAVVAPGRMAAWLAALAQRGVDPAVMLPAPLLLPEPEEGHVRADLPGQGVVRGRTSGWADEARLTDLVTGGIPPLTLDRGVLHGAAVAAVAAPALNLRQGMFARRTRRAVDWRLVRRLGILIGLILLATLAIDMVRIMRYSFGADSLEVRADAIAREGLPRGANANDGDAPRILADRLARLRGPGQGFTRTTAAIYQVVQAMPDSEVTGVQFEPNGSLRVSLSVPGETQANAIKSRLANAGFTVESSVFAQVNGRLAGDMTVRP
ncbi:type II secretion system protein GspL [Sphingomonas sp.]|jgi:general secretion pathway protein L|uniref:type II secretion system protein GspL n=1 Tax=Sphingomonas sp. TaxID=28214 RepID=UPI0035C81436